LNSKVERERESERTRGTRFETEEREAARMEKVNGREIFHKLNPDEAQEGEGNGSGRGKGSGE